MPQSNCVLRRAQPSEAPDLTALAVRSKASWGYDEAFMRRVFPDLQITERHVEESETIVAEQDGIIAGFLRLTLTGCDAFITDLWVEPEHFGRGIGRDLFEKAVEIARSAGSATLALHADPNAEAFYKRMGMRAVSQVRSAVAANRFLPVMVLDLE